MISSIIWVYMVVGAFTAGVGHGLELKPEITVKEHMILWFAWPYVFWKGMKCK